MKLYEIKEVYQNLIDMEQEGLDVKAYIEQVEGELEEKFQNIGLVYKTLLAEAEAIKVEEKKLSDRRKALENKSDNLKQWLYTEMVSMGIDKVNKPNIVLSIAKNPPKLVLNEELVPEQYKVPVTTITIDKSQIKDELKAGSIIPGAELVQDTSLRIK